MLHFQSSDKPSSPSAQPDRRTHSDFLQSSNAALNNDWLRKALPTLTLHYDNARRARLQELPDSFALRAWAGQIRQHTLDHLDHYLEQLAANVEKAGGHVHFAIDAAQAQQIILDIARKTGSQRIVKSRSLISQEIHLTATLEEAGLDVTETDPATFIAQITHDQPSHFCSPILHKDRASIAKALGEYLETPCDDKSPSLAAQLRAHLQEKFRLAQMGITGANFLIAETGQVCQVSNQGNARLVTAMPPVLVTLASLEKVLPRLADLSALLKLLSRSATGQTMTAYTALFGGPRNANEQDGPSEFHLVLLDNGRSRILRTDYREVLRCIHCGACQNACPVYRHAGGHAYGHVYSGPIGSILAPLLDGLEKHKELPHACTSCGVCSAACPVGIDLQKHQLNLRRETIVNSFDSSLLRMLARTWLRLMGSSVMARAARALQRTSLRRRAKGTGWITQAPGPLSAWTHSRDLPAPAEKSFQQLWQERHSDSKEARHD